MKYSRIPRKIKKKIPKNTQYCYEATSGMIYEKGELPYFKIKICPHYTNIKFKDMKPKPSWIDKDFLAQYGEEIDSWCKLIKNEIMDQCKSCGVGYGKYD